MSPRRRKPAAAPVVALPEPVAPEVGWSRSTFEWWDAVWDRLPAEARALYLDLVGGDGAGLDPDDPRLAPLVAQRLVQVEVEGLTLPAPTLDFARRMAAISRTSLLRDEVDDEDPLAEFIDMALDLEGLPPRLMRAFPCLRQRGDDPARHLAKHVASPAWAPAALPEVRSPGAPVLLHQLRGAGVLRHAEIRRRMGANATAAIDDLVEHLLAFEGLDAEDGALLLGLLPGLRAREADVGPALHGAPGAPPAPLHQPAPPPKKSGKAKRAPETEPAAPALADLGPDDGPRPRPWLLDDLEALLVHVAHERCRLTRYQGLYVEDQARLEAALLAGAPGPVDANLRAKLALELAHDLELVERRGSTTDLLRPRAGAPAWLERPIGERWRAVLAQLKDDAMRRRRRWLGGSLDTLAERVGRWPPRQDAVARLVAPLRDLAPGRRYALGDVARRETGERNPVVQAFLDRLEGMGQGRPTGEALTRAVRSHLRWVLPEIDLQRVDAVVGLSEAWRRGVETLLRQLVAVGGARTEATGDALTFSLTDVGRFYLGFTDAFPAEPLPGEAPAKVVVQPNLEVVLIGRAPAALVRLALLAERRPGEQGPARTLQLSRERVVESIARGSTPDELEAALVAAAGGAPIPDNVRRTVRDWARAVKRVRLVHVPVLLTDDEETALTARSIAGKGVVLPGHVVPVDPKKLSAFRKALQKRGVVVDEGALPADDPAW